MRYRKANLKSLHLRERCEEQDGLLFGATQVQIPSIAFGTKDPTSLKLTKSDHTSWYNETWNLPEVHRVRLRNAVVHPPFGIITIDNSVLQETLAYIPFHLPGYAQNDEEVTLPWEGVGGSLKEAIHVMGGNYMNHYHWLLDIVPKLQIDPLSQFAFEGSILMSPVTSVAQQEMLMRLLQAGRSVMSLAGRGAIHVESLLFVPNLANYGFAPNPGLTPFFDKLRQLLGVDGVSTSRIYVSRKGSQNRALVNEDEVIALVGRYGFKAVDLSSLTLTDQARLFATASHIIAPHGAGLANLVFCNPGATICELHMHGYLNWVFRKLAGIRGANYGCVVGAPEPSENKWVHSWRWAVPLMQLEEVLNDTHL